MQVDMHIDFSCSPWRARLRMIWLAIIGGKTVLKVDITPRIVEAECQCDSCNRARVRHIAASPYVN